jgi:hypothetical protein
MSLREPDPGVILIVGYILLVMGLLVALEIAFG